jgi:hypothetical protein
MCLQNYVETSTAVASTAVAYTFVPSKHNNFTIPMLISSSPRNSITNGPSFSTISANAICSSLEKKFMQGTFYQKGNGPLVYEKMRIDSRIRVDI